MSYLLISQLTQVRDEFNSAKAAIDYLEHSWGVFHVSAKDKNLQRSHVLRASANLEASYIIRLFSTFEGVLRNILPLRSPNTPDRRGAYDLINRAASKWRITTAIKDEAHLVRSFRNTEVHQNQSTEADIHFTDALASLNRFLSWLPNPP